MSTPFSPSSAMPRRSPAARALGAASALAASGLTLGLMLVLFHQTGPFRWFPADAEVLAAEAQCRAATGRPAEYHCIDAALVQRAGAVRLAGAEATADTATRR
ncbi:MAG: hypothetical protein H6933_08695 [Burkholderiaceae bacterium]|nr:hypothetical protein [Rhodoferax sp.]MCP5284964.1 hypothetical protein [Burkholderiaceae bacterium]